MPEEPLGVILRCAVQCDKATAGLKELHKKAIKATKIPPIEPPVIPMPKISKPETFKPEIIPKPEMPKPPEVPKIEAPKIEKPEIPKVETPKVEPSKMPELYMPPIKPIKIKPEIEIIKPSKALETMKKAVEEDTLAMREGFKKLGTPMQDSEEQVRDLSKAVGEELPRDWRKGFEAAGKAALGGLGPTKLVTGSAEKLGKILGIDVPKITEKGAMQQIKMYRWIGRDLIRLGRMTGKVGQRIQKVFGAMTQHSVALGSVVDDLTYAYEELTSELGEALAPVLEPLAEIVWAFTDWFLEQPDLIKKMVGAFIVFGMVLMKIVPFLMIFRGYLLLNRFSLMQAAAATKVTTKATTRFGRATQRTSRMMKKFGRTLKFSTPLIAGLGAAFMTIQTGGSIAEAATWGLMSAGTMMMFILPGWTKLIGALVAGIGALVGWLTSSKEETDKVPASLIDMMESMEYTEEEAYSMGEQVWATFKMVNSSYASSTDASKAFQYRMEELGFEVKDITPLWKEMGGSIEDIVPSFDTLRESFEKMPDSAAHAMVLIHAALDDGKITQGEWEYIINTSAWESFETKFPEMAGYMMDNINDMLKEKPITLADWEDAFGFFVFLKIQDGLWTKASGIWDKMKSNYSVNQINLLDYITPFTEGDLNIPDIDLDDYISSPQPWSEIITLLVWKNRVPPLWWDDYVSQLDLGTYISPDEVDLGDYITPINWGQLLGEYRDFFLKAAQYMEAPFANVAEAIETLNAMILTQGDDMRTWFDTLMDMGYGFTNLSDILSKIDTGKLEEIPAILKAIEVGTPAFEIIRAIPGGENWLRAKGYMKEGGYVQTTGLYGLHAGEYVVPAGSSSSITNTFYITASIRDDTDITKLADEISRLQSEEYRRA